MHYLDSLRVIQQMSNTILRISFLVYFLVLVALLVHIPESQSSPDRYQFQNLKQLNNNTASILQSLVQTKYFRLLRLNLNSECPLPYMNKLCKSKSCSVCRCDEKDIPQNWIVTDKVQSAEQDKDVWSKEREQYTSKWVWHVEDEENDRGEYFDVNQNVESYSGYNGSYVWSLIYEENCFKGVNHFDQMCLEEQVLYKMLSGLHTSISTHLSRLYKNVTKAALWADRGDESFFFNHYEYQNRVLNFPERIKNLLFLYEILMRSVQHMVHYLEQHHLISSDNVIQDFEGKKLMDQLLKIVKKVPFKPIAETDAFFFEAENPHVKQYQRYIHNISNILNCVECEKCRLFGKMQTYGLGTALKVLLGYNFEYKRNEVVAIFNTLNKISISINTYFNYPQFLGEGIGGKSSLHVYQNVQNKLEGRPEDELILVKVWASIGFWPIGMENAEQKNSSKTYSPEGKPRIFDYCIPQIFNHNKIQDEPKCKYFCMNSSFEKLNFNVSIPSAFVCECLCQLSNNESKMNGKYPNQITIV